MNRKFLNFSMKKIKEKYPEYTEDKLEEIEYGIESLYILFTKTIVIFLLSYLLGVIKEVFIILIFYNILRMTCFGLHAKTSFQCYIISGVLFIGAGFLCKYININYYLKIIISLLCLINIIIFAPADTYKRPLINNKKRRKYKILSIIISLIYFTLIILFHNYGWNNYLFFGLIDITVVIHPFTYWMFQLPYNNYKTYVDKYY